MTNPRSPIVNQKDSLIQFTPGKSRPVRMAGWLKNNNSTRTALWICDFVMPALFFTSLAILLTTDHDGYIPGTKELLSNPASASSAGAIVIYSILGLSALVSLVLLSISAVYFFNKSKVGTSYTKYDSDLYKKMLDTSKNIPHGKEVTFDSPSVGYFFNNSKSNIDYTEYEQNLYKKIGDCSKKAHQLNDVIENVNSKIPDEFRTQFVDLSSSISQIVMDITQFYHSTGNHIKFPFKSNEDRENAEGRFGMLSYTISNLSNELLNFTGEEDDTYSKKSLINCLEALEFLKEDFKNISNLINKFDTSEDIPLVVMSSKTNSVSLSGKCLSKDGFIKAINSKIEEFNKKIKSLRLLFQAYGKETTVDSESESESESDIDYTEHEPDLYEKIEDCSVNVRYLNQVVTHLAENENSKIPAKFTTQLVDLSSSLSQIVTDITQFCHSIRNYMKPSFESNEDRKDVEEKFRKLGDGASFIGDFLHNFSQEDCTLLGNDFIICSRNFEILKNRLNSVLDLVSKFNISEDAPLCAGQINGNSIASLPGERLSKDDFLEIVNPKMEELNEKIKSLTLLSQALSQKSNGKEITVDSSPVVNFVNNSESDIENNSESESDIDYTEHEPNLYEEINDCSSNVRYLNQVVTHLAENENSKIPAKFTTQLVDLSSSLSQIVTDITQFCHSIRNYMKPSFESNEDRKDVEEKFHLLGKGAAFVGNTLHDLIREDCTLLGEDFIICSRNFEILKNRLNSVLDLVSKFNISEDAPLCAGRINGNSIASLPGERLSKDDFLEIVNPKMEELHEKFKSFTLLSQALSQESNGKETTVDSPSVVSFVNNSESDIGYTEREPDLYRKINSCCLEMINLNKLVISLTENTNSKVTVEFKTQFIDLSSSISQIVTDITQFCHSIGNYMKPSFESNADREDAIEKFRLLGDAVFYFKKLGLLVENSEGTPPSEKDFASCARELEFLKSSLDNVLNLINKFDISEDIPLCVEQIRGNSIASLPGERLSKDDFLEIVNPKVEEFNKKVESFTLLSQALSQELNEKEVTVDSPSVVSFSNNSKSDIENNSESESDIDYTEHEPNLYEKIEDCSKKAHYLNDVAVSLTKNANSKIPDEFRTQFVDLSSSVFQIVANITQFCHSIENHIKFSLKSKTDREDAKNKFHMLGDALFYLSHLKPLTEGVNGDAPLKTDFISCVRELEFLKTSFDDVLNLVSKFNISEDIPLCVGQIRGNSIASLPGERLSKDDFLEIIDPEMKELNEKIKSLTLLSQALSQKSNRKEVTVDSPSVVSFSNNSESDIDYTEHEPDLYKRIDNCYARMASLNELVISLTENTNSKVPAEFKTQFIGLFSSISQIVMDITQFYHSIRNHMKLFFESNENRKDVEEKFWMLTNTISPLCDKLLNFTRKEKDYTLSQESLDVCLKELESLKEDFDNVLNLIDKFDISEDIPLVVMPYKPNSVSLSGKCLSKDDFLKKINPKIEELDDKIESLRFLSQTFSQKSNGKEITDRLPSTVITKGTSTSPDVQTPSRIS